MYSLMRAATVEEKCDYGAMNCNDFFYITTSMEVASIFGSKEIRILFPARAKGLPSRLLCIVCMWCS